MDESIIQLLKQLRLTHSHLVEGVFREINGNSYIASTKPTHQLDPISELHRLRELWDCLRIVEAHVGGQVELLREQTKATIVERGIAHLPNELLSLVFELGHPSNNRGFLYAVRISQVCKRFRKVALSATRLWSTIASDLPPEAVALSLERSRASFLSVILNYDDDVVAFMKLVQPHYVRWEELSITYTAETQPPKITFPTRFPNLHTLRLAYKIEKGFLVEEDECKKYLVNPFGRNCSLPVLQTLDVKNITAKFTLRQSITSMILAFVTPEATDWALDFTIGNLEGLTNLQHLSLRFEHFGKFDFSTTYSTIRLPALTDLHLTIHGSNESILLGRLLGALHLPSFKRYTIDLRVKSMKEWFSACFRSGANFRSLESVHIIVRTRIPEENTALIVYDAVKCFPQIRHLTISFPRTKVTAQVNQNFGDLNLHSLHSLQFINCHNLNDDEMELLFEKAKGEEYPNKILLQSHQGLSDEFVRKWSKILRDRLEISHL